MSSMTGKQWAINIREKCGQGKIPIPRNKFLGPTNSWRGKSAKDLISICLVPRVINTEVQSIFFYMWNEEF